MCSVSWPSNMKLIAVPGRLRQDVGKFEASLRYSVRLCDEEIC